MLVIKLNKRYGGEIEIIKNTCGDIEEIIQVIDQGRCFYVLVSTSNVDRIQTIRTLQNLKIVEHVAYVETPYVLSSRASAIERTIVRVTDDLVIGGNEFVVIAGPCTVESEQQTCEIARDIKSAGSRILRGGAYKPRTSPFSFQGLGEDGLEILRKARQQTGIPVVTELLDQKTIKKLDQDADIIQVGMRNALNYALLSDLGNLKSRKPVLLKCGIATTLNEFLAAADYILAGGNPNVILCLRGTIGFSQESRSAMNVADIPALRRRTHLPIIVDPSHVAGKWELVPAISAAALVAGADGIMVEVHNHPEKALSDGRQSLRPPKFARMMYRLRALATIMGRKMVDSRVVSKFDSDVHPCEDLCLEAPPGGTVNANLKSKYATNVHSKGAVL